MPIRPLALFPAAVLLSATATIAVHAQTTPRPPIRTISHYIVKSDRVGDMQAAIKEYNEILKKATWEKSYTIWRSDTGPREYIRVDYHQKWADLDASLLNDPKLKEYRVDLTRITRRISDSFESSSRVVEMVDQQASTPLSTDIPKMVMVWTAHVKNGKMPEAVAAERNEYAAAVKTAGIKSYVFTRARFGAPYNEIRSSLALDKYADLDGDNPIRKAMGDEKYRAFAEKMNGLLDDFHYEIYIHQPQLSYIAAR